MSEKVDVSKLRAGDRILVQFVIDSPKVDSDGDICAKSPSKRPDDYTFIRAADIVSVEPRPLKVGDRVYSGGGEANGASEVIAIHEGWVWIRHPQFGNAVRLAGDLRRADL